MADQIKPEAEMLNWGRLILDGIGYSDMVAARDRPARPAGSGRDFLIRHRALHPQESPGQSARPMCCGSYRPSGGPWSTGKNGATAGLRS